MKLSVPCVFADDGQHEVEFKEDGQISSSCDQAAAESAARLGQETCFIFLSEWGDKIRGAAKTGRAWCASCCGVVPVFYRLTEMWPSFREAGSPPGSRFEHDRACVRCGRSDVLRDLPP
jgi:hypothetical protein